MRLRSPVPMLALAIVFALVAHVVAGDTDPIESKPTNPVMTAPDAFAWEVFAEINRPLNPQDPEGGVAWEGWALARTVFSDPDVPPSWTRVSKRTRIDELESDLLQQKMLARARRSMPDEDASTVAHESRPVRPSFDVVAAQSQRNETRMNRAAFDYIIKNELFNIEGQEAFFRRGENLNFPIEAREIKAQWRRISESEVAKYHTHRESGVDGKVVYWGLTALHITTKDIPKWFWATWEHEDNVGRESVVPSVDTHGLPDSLEGTKWAHYVLRGTQVSYVNSIGQATVLANSQIERGFQETSSCMTCHARATIGPTPHQRISQGRLAEVGANRLSVFDGENGSIGVPDPAWFVATDRAPAARKYVQTDFVWSLMRALRKTTPVSESSETERSAAERAKFDDASPVVKITVPGGVDVGTFAARHAAYEPKLARFVDAGDQAPNSDPAVLELRGADVEALLTAGIKREQIRIERPAHRIDNLRAKTMQLIDMQNRNLDARISHFVPQYAGTYNVSGKGVAAAVFDEGAVRATHVEFRRDRADPTTTRVKLKTGAPDNEHSTHVAGTIGAHGQRPTAQGMAPQISILSFDWSGDTGNLRRIGKTASVSNHSYGPAAGWDQDLRTGQWRWWGDERESAAQDVTFGRYGIGSSELDAVLHANQGMCTFVAAGNDRGDAPTSQPIQHLVRRFLPGGSWTWRTSSRRRPADGADRGLDTISGYGTAKNVLCIGAVDDVLPPHSRIAITSYSGFGPTDDGRIKPDLVANGHWLLSTSNADDLAYVSMPGTSMASPTAAGIGALMVEHFRRERGRAPSSAEIKAILIHTAIDAGVPGPDPMYGWGSIHALDAGHVIKSASGQRVIRGDVTQAEPFNLQLTGASESVRVTLVWIDPPGASASGRINDRTPVLVNDLDLVVTAPGGTIRHPYTLDETDPHRPARQDRPNRLDNVERVDAPAAAGTWNVSVKAERIAAGARQSFALVVSGLK